MGLLQIVGEFGWLLFAVGHSLLSSHVQRRSKRKRKRTRRGGIRYAAGKDQTCPKELDNPNQQEVI